MGVFSYLARKFDELGGQEYSKQQVQDGVQFGRITQALLPNVSLVDAVKNPKIWLAGVKFVFQHGRPNIVNVAVALEAEGIDVPSYQPDPPPPI